MALALTLSASAAGAGNDPASSNGTQFQQIVDTVPNGSFRTGANPQQAELAVGEQRRMREQGAVVEGTHRVQQFDRPQAACHQGALHGREMLVHMGLEAPAGLARERGHLVQHAVAGGLGDRDGERGVHQRVVLVLGQFQ